MKDLYSRITWIDIVKGVLIILVVLGHSGDIGHGTRLAKYLYWFHMPAFVIASGLTFKAPTTNEFIKWIQKPTRRLLIPYFFFLALLALLKYLPPLITGQGFNWVVEDFTRALMGGPIAPSYFWALWFITALFATQILFAILEMSISSRVLKFALIACIYAFAHIQVYHRNTPWSIDSSLLFLAYFAIGFYGKELFMDLKPLVIGVGSFLSLCLILDNHYQVLSYKLDIKVHVYNNLFLDLVVPLIFTLTVFSLCQWISRFPDSTLLQYIGMESMIILYLHEPVNIILHQLYDYGALIFTIIGTFIPVLISLFLFKRFRLTRFLSTGYIAKR